MIACMLIVMWALILDGLILIHPSIDPSIHRSIGTNTEAGSLVVYRKRQAPLQRQLRSPPGVFCLSGLIESTFVNLAPSLFAPPCRPRAAPMPPPSPLK